MSSETLRSGGYVEPSVEEPKYNIGEKMPDGTIYAGVSPNTGNPIYALPADGLLTMDFDSAVRYAKYYDAHGHQDWRLPTSSELSVLFNNRAAIGGFNTSGANMHGWYWSATSHNKWSAWCQRFSDGRQDNFMKDAYSSVRLIRG